MAILTDFWRKQNQFKNIKKAANEAAFLVNRKILSSYLLFSSS